MKGSGLLGSTADGWNLEDASVCGLCMGGNRLLLLLNQKRIFLLFRILC